MAKSNQKEPKNDPGLPLIEYTTNWNGKLFTNAVTTIRLWQPNKYVVGRDYRFIQIQKMSVNTDWGQWKLVQAKPIQLIDVDDYIGYLDTGYSGEATQEIMRKMYTGKVKDIETAWFGLYLLVKQFK